ERFGFVFFGLFAPALCVDVADRHNLAGLLLFSPNLVNERASELPRPPQPTSATLIRSFAPSTREGLILLLLLANALAASATPAPMLPVRFRKSRRSNWSADIKILSKGQNASVLQKPAMPPLEGKRSHRCR